MAKKRGTRQLGVPGRWVTTPGGGHDPKRTDLDESQDAAEAEDADDAQQRRRDGELVEDVLHDEADDGGRHQDQIEQVPRQREVVVAQADDLDHRLCCRPSTSSKSKWPINPLPTRSIFR